MAKLVEGFESPFGLELLSTVHWVVTKEGASTVEDTTQKVYAWNDQKRKFNHRQIKLAFEILADKGWFTPFAPK